MRRVEGLGNLNRVLQSLIEWERTFLQSIGKRLAFQVLHHQEIGAFVVANVVERADVRVIERSDSARFTLEPLTAIGI